MLCLLAALTASAQSDTLRTLRDVEVKYEAPAAGVSIDDDGAVRISTAGARRTLRNLGEADVLSVAGMLPGYGSSSDYASGMSVRGSDYSQNAYVYDGATVFFPYRFGGVFSDFNPNHVSSLDISQALTTLSEPVIGANIHAHTPDYSATAIGGDVNLGLIASAATLRLPLTSRMSLTASARMSHINYLYDKVLTDADRDLRYTFADYNATMISQFDDHTRLKVSALYSADRLMFDDAGFLLTTHLKWRNAAVSADLTRRSGTYTVSHVLSYSSFASRLGLGMPQYALALPSGVSQLAMSGQLESHAHPYSVGYRLEYNSYEPQYSVTDGDVGTKRRVDAWLVALGFGRAQTFGDFNTLRLNALLSFYTAGGYHHIGLDRKVSYAYGTGPRSITASISFTTQYMHHVGFSDIGLASNFYLPSTRGLPAQESASVDLGYSTQACDGRLTIMCNAYVRSVFNASEYMGDVISVMAQAYDPFQHIAVGDGYDFGADLTLRYALGPLSGWAGYALNVARRKYYSLDDRWHPSANEQLHSLKVMTDYALSPKLKLAAYFVASSGRRYTPIKRIYIVGGNVLAEYGERNSGHLPTYHRLDLSATYTLPCFRVGHRQIGSYINLSLINAYGHDNVEMQYYDYDNEYNTVQMRKIHSVYRLLPSLSYSVEF